MSSEPIKKPRDTVAPDDEMLPLLSTTDKGARMTRLAVGQRPGRLDGELVVRMLLCGATWALASSVPYAALLGLAPTPRVSEALGSPWAFVAGLVLLYLAILQATRIHGRAKAVFGQTRVAALLSTLAITGGLAAGAAVWTLISMTAQPVPPLDIGNLASSLEIPRELGVAVGGAFAVWAIVMLLRLPGALRHAGSRQRMLERLRATGTRREGALTAVIFDNTWVFDEPYFTLRVSYEDDGGTRVIPAWMRTSADRVPVVGTRVVVLTDGAGAVSVELDASTPPVFEDENRYRAPEG